jgi:hypothetical protein
MLLFIWECKKACTCELIHGTGFLLPAMGHIIPFANITIIHITSIASAMGTYYFICSYYTPNNKRNSLAGRGRALSPREPRYYIHNNKRNSLTEQTVRKFSFSLPPQWRIEVLRCSRVQATIFSA